MWGGQPDSGDTVCAKVLRKERDWSCVGGSTAWRLVPGRLDPAHPTELVNSVIQSKLLCPSSIIWGLQLENVTVPGILQGLKKAASVMVIHLDKWAKLCRTDHVFGGNLYHACILLCTHTCFSTCPPCFPTLNPNVWCFLETLYAESGLRTSGACSVSTPPARFQSPVLPRPQGRTCTYQVLPHFQFVCQAAQLGLKHQGHSSPWKVLPQDILHSDLTVVTLSKQMEPKN